MYEHEFDRNVILRGMGYPSDAQSGGGINDPDLHLAVAAVLEAWQGNRQHPTAEWEPVGEELARALDRLVESWPS
jgi:hypothetical protein